MPPAPRPQLFGGNLAFIAGFIDTVGFIALFGLFTAHVTGNFVLIGATLSDFSRAPVLLKFLAFPAFIAGIVLLRIAILKTRLPEGGALRLALVLEALLMAGFMVDRKSVV